MKQSGLLRSPTKRLHFAEGVESDGLSLNDMELSLSQLERLDFGKLSSKKCDGNPVEYKRSVSLPARELKYEDGESHSQAKKQNENETSGPDRSHSDSYIDRQAPLKTTASSLLNVTLDLSSTGDKMSLTKEEGKITNGEHSNVTDRTAMVKSDSGSLLTTSDLEVCVPKKFDFSSTGDTGEGLPKRNDDEKPNDRDRTEEGVFVFTATTSSTDPKSPDFVKSKRKSGSVSFNLLPEEITVAHDGGEGELAMLTQQLELGGSDNVSFFTV